MLWGALPNGRRATFYDVWAGHRMRPARFRRRLEEDLGEVFTRIADGRLAPRVAARFPLVEVAAAMAPAESRTLDGKVVLVP